MKERARQSGDGDVFVRFHRGRGTRGAALWTASVVVVTAIIAVVLWQASTNPGSITAEALPTAGAQSSTGASTEAIATADTASASVGVTADSSNASEPQSLAETVAPAEPSEPDFGANTEPQLTVPVPDPAAGIAVLAAEGNVADLSIGDCFVWRTGGHSMSDSADFQLAPCDTVDAFTVYGFADVPASKDVHVVNSAIFDQCFRPVLRPVVGDDGAVTTWQRSVDSLGWSANADGLVLNWSMFTDKHYSAFRYRGGAVCLSNEL